MPKHTDNVVLLRRRARRKVALRLRQLRKRLNLSQPAMAEAIGVSRRQLVDYEGGLTKVPADVMVVAEELAAGRLAA